MSKRVCLGPADDQRCPTAALIPAGKSRCPSCSRSKDKARGTRQARGYDRDHDQLRADWQRKLDAGQTVHCWRCGDPINPSNWTLGHCDIDRRRYHGPECPPCDYATSGRVGCPHPSHSGVSHR